MNVFFLDRNPIVCASYHCNKHISKLAVEAAQMLSTAHHVTDTGKPHPFLYKATHINHPCSKWVRESTEHYNWLYQLLEALLEEYTNRYGREHSTSRLLPLLKTPPVGLPAYGFMDPPLAMPDHYKKAGDAVACYRAYYLGDKARFAKWPEGSTPPWWLLH